MMAPSCREALGRGVQLRLLVPTSYKSTGGDKEREGFT